MGIKGSEECQQRTAMYRKPKIPPLAKALGGEVVWQDISKIDFEFIGFFLSCHLIIENYMDEYLKAKYPALDWEKSKLTFNHKINLLNNDLPKKLNVIPLVKHLNGIRNKLSHNIHFRITEEDLLPLQKFIDSVEFEHPDYLPSEQMTPIGLIDVCTLAICIMFAVKIHHEAGVLGAKK